MQITEGTLVIGDVRRSGISFSVKAGEIVALVAKSGFGKTSLFRYFLGKTDIYLDKTNLDLCKSIGYVPQNGGLIDWLTFQEHLEIFEIPTEMNCLKILSIDHLLKQKIKYLSGGEYHRVLLYISTKKTTNYLLLDEPFVSLDIYTKDKTKKWVCDQISERKLGVVVASHDLNLIHDMCKKVFVMNGKSTKEINISKELCHEELQEQILLHM